MGAYCRGQPVCRQYSVASVSSLRVAIVGRKAAQAEVSCDEMACPLRLADLYGRYCRDVALDCDATAFVLWRGTREDRLRVPAARSGTYGEAAALLPDEVKNIRIYESGGDLHVPAAFKYSLPHSDLMPPFKAAPFEAMPLKAAPRVASPPHRPSCIRAGFLPAPVCRDRSGDRRRTCCVCCGRAP